MSITPANKWKKAGGGGEPQVELELPSGNVALVTRPGMWAFLQQGIIPNTLLEPIMAELDSNNPKKKGKATSEKDVGNELMQKPELLADMFELVDRVTVHCVVEPQVLAVPEPHDDRDPDALYVDEVEMGDKMFIFNFTVGGSSDLTRFREEVGSTMAALENGGEVPVPAKRPSRARK